MCSACAVVSFRTKFPGTGKLKQNRLPTNSRYDENQVMVGSKQTVSDLETNQKRNDQKATDAKNSCAYANHIPFGSSP